MAQNRASMELAVGAISTDGVLQVEMLSLPADTRRVALSMAEVSINDDGALLVASADGVFEDLLVTGTATFGGGQTITPTETEMNMLPVTNVGWIDFDLVNNIPQSEGRLVWNPEDGTLNLGMPGGEVVGQILQEQLIRGKNVTGSATTNGRPALITGASGNKAEFAFADANDPAANTHGIGVFTEDISTNANGYVTTFGLVRDFDTTGTDEGEVWAAGDELYVSNTAGRFTTVAPTADERKIHIGFVIRVHATEGTVFVNPHPHSYLSELSGNNFGAEVAKDVIQYDGTVWTNSQDLTLGGNLDVTGTTLLNSELTLAGTARVSKHIIVKPEAAKLGATSPAAAIIGTFSVLEFAGVGPAESIYTSFHTPTDWETGTDINVHVHWAPTNANAGTVVWQMTWDAVASEANEVIGGAGTTVFVADATKTLENELLESGDMTITGTDISAEDTIGICIFRDPAHGSDNYASAASLVWIEMTYTADKLGEAT